MVTEMTKPAKNIEPAMQIEIVDSDCLDHAANRSVKFQPVSEILKSCDEKAGQLYRSFAAFA